MATTAITLYLKQGTSDKVYRAAIEEGEGGYTVTFAYGRRGAAMTPGTKTPTPVPLAQAQALYGALVREKQAKGYSQGADTAPFVGTPKEAAVSGELPQLLNSIDVAEASELLADPGWWLQEKVDGRRVMICRTTSGEVWGINRKGLRVALPEPIAKAAAALGVACLIDGELISSTDYVAFDLLKVATYGDLRERPYSDRWAALAAIVCPGKAGAAIRLLGAADTPETKARLYTELVARKAEGVVFKLASAPYTAGRPNSGGTQRKYKFVQSASCLVMNVTGGRRSVGLALYDGAGVLVEAGRVSIPANKEIPEVGALCEVRYLYALKASGALYQPFYIGLRDDIDAAACTTAQLKYKAEGADDAE